MRDRGLGEGRYKKIYPPFYSLPSPSSVVSRVVHERHVCSSAAALSSLLCLRSLVPVRFPPMPPLVGRRRQIRLNECNLAVNRDNAQSQTSRAVMAAHSKGKMGREEMAVHLEGKGKKEQSAIKNHKKGVNSYEKGR